MAKKVIDWAAREKRRAVNAAVGKSFLKTITELVTNSDSALKNQACMPHAAGLVDELFRLKVGERVVTPELKKNIPQRNKRKILVQIFSTESADRKSRLCKIVDTGPGMSTEELELKFGTYASAKAKGESTRSIFGRGALDVLLYHKDSVIFTVSKGILSRCRIFWENDAHCDPEALGTVTKALLDKYDLPHEILASGTVVQFQLREGTPIPQEDRIVDCLSCFYMLRLIAADPNTELVVERHRGGGKFVSPARYDFPMGVVLARCADELKGKDGISLPVDILMARSDTPLQTDPVFIDRRVNGLLFVDDNDAVLDLTLLPEYDKNPLLSHIYGIVRITNIRAVLESFLEVEEAVAVLSETRDGFNRKHELTQALFKLVEKHVRPVYEKEENRLRKGDSTRTEALNQRIKDALKVINEFNLTEMEEEEGVPALPIERDETIYFEVKSIRLYAGVAKTIRACVNPEKVKHGEIILFDSDNPEIQISPDSELVVVGKRKKHQRIDLRVVCQLKGQKGVITALTLGKDGKEHSAKLVILGVDDAPIFQPPADIEFVAPRYYGQPNRSSRAILMVNLDAFTGKPELSFWLEENEGNVTLGDKGLDSLKIKVSEEHMISGHNIARIPVPFNGTGWGQHAVLWAKAKRKDANIGYAKCKVRFDKPPGNDKFSDFLYEPFDRNVLGDVSEDKIYINAKYKIHQQIFGTSQADFDRETESNPIAQQRAAQVVIEAVVYDIASRKWQKGGAKGLHINTDDPISSLRIYIEESRMQLEPSVLAALAPNMGKPTA